MSVRTPTSVVIAGGGVAALEAAFAVRDLAGDRVSVLVLAPNEDFAYRPMAVREPFAYPPAQRYPLAEIVHDAGAGLIVDELAWVDATRCVAHTAGDAEIPYNALLLALGARAKEPFALAVTLDDRRADQLLHGVVQDIEDGYVHSIAFVSPARLGWPLPMYELALMTAARAYDSGMHVDITVVTPEKAPLEIFGEEASGAVAALLRDAGIATMTSANAHVPQQGRIAIGPGERELSVDRVIAMPELFGPAVRGLRSASHGFIPIDAHCQVPGAPGVYAAGDATDFPVKHGGPAAQQADVAATSIAALAGIAITQTAFQPEIRGILLTGRKPRYLTARIIANSGFESQLTDEPPWDPPAKIASKYLAPYLERRPALSARGVVAATA